MSDDNKSKMSEDRLILTFIIYYTITKYVFFCTRCKITWKFSVAYENKYFTSRKTFNIISRDLFNRQENHNVIVNYK